MAYCIYLRKSRADSAQETEVETLSRHETILVNLAKSQKLNIDKIYREVVTGESIAARPQMQELLAEVELGNYDGVLVIELERLGRGNSIDQGIISETFRYSDTKIITPTKTYDLSNEFDDEYTEFGLFMSRREYKTINRRLQRGRLLSINEGKFIGSVPPYGYDRMKLKKGYSLTPNDESDTVKLIFNLYVNKRIGPSLIANHLNHLKIKPRKDDVWTPATIKTILANEVYIGKIRYDYRKTVKKMQNNQLTKARPRNTDYLLTNGLHKPLIDNNTFAQAQEISTQNSTPKTKKDMELRNPLANIIRCGKCGRAMIRRPYPNREPSLICTCKQCNNVGSDLSLVEKKVIQRLELWLTKYQVKIGSMKKSSYNDDNLRRKSIQALETELKKINSQINNLCDLLEQNAYTIEMFRERNKLLTEKKSQLSQDISTLESAIKGKERQKENVEKYSRIIELYKQTHSVEVKNSLLREVLVKVEYVKEKSGRWSDPNDFKLILYPKL